MIKKCGGHFCRRRRAAGEQEERDNQEGQQSYGGNANGRE
jgi:hypothetical protein